MLQDKIYDISTNLLVKVATPFSIGTGFVLQEYGLVVTNEQNIRGYREVVISNAFINESIVKVVYYDLVLDIAYLQMPSLSLPTNLPPISDDFSTKMAAIGLTENGIVHSLMTTLQEVVAINNANYIKTSTDFESYLSGGPLLNEKGEIVGVNTFYKKGTGEHGISLSINELKSSLIETHQANETLRKCDHCLISVPQAASSCPACQKELVKLKATMHHQPTGVGKSIESLIKKLGYDLRMARKGPNSWAMIQGSATINISYYEPLGYILADAFLCEIKQTPSAELCQFLLKQNNIIKGLTFSIKEKDIVLSLIIYDANFDASVALELLQDLMEKADYYDNVLVDNFNTKWKQHSIPN